MTISRATLPLGPKGFCGLPLSSALTPPALPSVRINWSWPFHLAFSPGRSKASWGLPPSICTTTQLSSVASRSSANCPSVAPDPSSEIPPSGPSLPSDEGGGTARSGQPSGGCWASHWPSRTSSTLALAGTLGGSTRLGLRAGRPRLGLLAWRRGLRFRSRWSGPLGCGAGRSELERRTRSDDCSRLKRKMSVRIAIPIATATAFRLA